MSIKVHDLDKVEAWKGGAGVIPTGYHNVEIKSADEGESSGGHPQVELSYESTAGNGEIREWLVFTEKSMGKARGLLDAVGIKAEGGEWEFPTDKLVGKKLVIYVGLEPDFKDPTKTRSRVQGHFETGSKSDVPIDRSDFTPPSGGNGSDGDDDIPF